MNKKLLTAAIGAALAAGPMLAQADVKLYGKMHVSVDYVDGQGAGNTAALSSNARKQTHVSSNASRWGIDVSEKLGGGLTAIGKLETEIDATNDGTNDFASRNRYVGLSGKFGTIIGGVMDTPFKDTGRAVEFFPEYVGDARNLTRHNFAVTNPSGITVAGTSVGWDERPRNSIRYTTPSFNGFAASYLYSAAAAGVNSIEDNRTKMTSLGLSYLKGPLFVGLAHENHQTPNAAPTSTGESATSEKGTRLAASYNFGAFKLGGMWQRLQDIGGVNSESAASVRPNSVKRTTWGLGGAYTAGNNVFKMQYYRAGNLSNDVSGGSLSDYGATMWALGWDHLFSKTAKAYVAYAKTDNAPNAAFSVNSGGHGDSITTLYGKDPSAWSVGMILDF